MDTNIPNQLSFHAPEEQEKVNVQKDKYYFMARIVSAVFTPFMVPLVAFLLLFFCTYLRIMPLEYKLIVLSMVYCFTVFLPMLAIYLYQKINGLGIRGLSNRKNRFIPYGLTIISYVGCLATMYKLHMPRYMSGIVIATLICMIICALVNLKIKVSTHVTSSGLLVGGLLSYSFLFHFNPVVWLSISIMLAGMLGSARIILRQHTLTEVTGGFLIGLFCGIIGILFI